MPREVSSVGPSNNPQPPRSFHNKDAGIGERKGSGGQGRGKEPEPEPETDEEATDETHLDEDSFAAGKKANLQNFLTDKLPWEQAEEERKRKLEAIKQKRMGTGKGTNPLGAGRDLLKPPVLPPRSMGRQVDGGFDATAAVNNTIHAHQSLRDRQAQARRAAEQPQQSPHAPTSRLGRMLTGTDAAPPESPNAAPDAASARAWPVQASAAEPAAPAKPVPPARPAAAKAPAGPIKPPARGSAPLKSLGGTLAPEPPEAPVARPAAPEPVAPPQAPVPAEPPAPTHMIEVRVVDGESGHSIPGARLEFEPTMDALLAVVNAQTDSRGTYRSDDVAPGHYLLAVRYPGYIPYSQTVTLATAQPLRIEVRMSKP